MAEFGYEMWGGGAALHFIPPIDPVDHAPIPEYCLSP
jgi:hypothetical protein